MQSHLLLPKVTPNSGSKPREPDCGDANIPRSCFGRCQARVQVGANKVKHISWSMIYQTMGEDLRDRARAPTSRDHLEAPGRCREVEALATG